MHSGNLNNTRYNDLGKLMKHSFQGKKKPRDNDLKRKIHYIKLRFTVKKEKQFIVNLITVIKLSYKPLRLL